MKAVGIKNLKDNLSKYLQLVQSGEVIWITDRDRVIAEILKPTIPVPNRISRWESFLNVQE
ncbi:MAG: type II toxin-antitoxin system Phd/YefM family antitoxin [Spirochaetaceae bacterium]|nr:MAG: type II toxin-antitoxin system Phd/YefM family antitoxin [Spirochaetaceae bacterium]